MRRSAFVAIALLVGGCSLFVDLDGLNDSSAGGADAFVPETGAAETGASDASKASDASGADAGPPFVCPDASIVCDDFDENPLGALWSRVTIQNGTLGIDDTASLSPPDSLLMTLPDNPGGATRYNRLEKDIGDMHSVDCELQLRLDATDSTGDYDVRPFAVEIYPPGFVNYEIHVNLAATEMSFEQNADTGADGGSVSQTDNFSPVTMGAWTHLRFATDFQRVQIFVDDTKVYDQALLAPISSTSSGKIEVGQAYDTEPPAWTYRIDNVSCIGN